MNYSPSNNLGFYHGFVASLSVIVVSELGDKTWFIAAVCFFFNFFSQKLLNFFQRFWQCAIQD